MKMIWLCSLLILIYCQRAHQLPGQNCERDVDCQGPNLMMALRVCLGRGRSKKAYKGRCHTWNPMKECETHLDCKLNRNDPWMDCYHTFINGQWVRSECVDNR